MATTLRSLSSLVYGDSARTMTTPSDAQKWDLPNGKAYVPGARCVMVIAAGAPWVWDNSVESTPRRSRPPPAHWSVNTLSDAGYDVTVIWDKSYDKNPMKRDELKRGGSVNLSTNKGKNNSTLADDVALPKLYELAEQGRGP